MEVFLKNVPFALTDESLRKELKPFMNALGVLDWTVDKPKRKNIAWLTFLLKADGDRFLNKHGKINISQNSSILAAAARLSLDNHAQHKARLHILSTPIYADRSRRDAKPLTLSQLRHDQEERQKAPQQGRRAPAISCTIREVRCGKLIFAPPTMGLKFIQQTYCPVAGCAKFGRQYLMVTLGENSRMDVPYKTIQELVVNHESQNMTLVLEEPPRFYSKMSSVYGNNGKWERQTSCPVFNDHIKYVAHCLVYQLIPAGNLRSIVHGLKVQDILSISQQSIPFSSSPIPALEDYTTSMNAFEGRMQSFETARNCAVPFPILFQVQALVWNNYLHPSGGLRMLGIIERWAVENSRLGKIIPFKTDTMKRLFPKIPYPVPGTDVTEVDPELLMEKVMRSELDLRSQDPFRSGVHGQSLPQHQTWVLKAVVTPTRIVLLGPDAESKNRVLRMFRNHGDHFLRVSFGDEGGQDLSFNPKVLNDAVYERYRKVLKEGIRIAGRHFSFLGFSHSSLRAHSTWFLAPFIDEDFRRQDHGTILKTLGDFSDIRIPAKCAARIGQAFSETPYTVDLSRSGISVRSIPDVKSADGERVFSDGVGTISTEAMEEFWKVLPMRSTTPTCFQIRWGGVKGMLALDPRLRGKVICVRKESMMKFPSHDLGELGICDVSARPLRLVLNRPVIKILEDMGTSSEWFLALQGEALNYLRDVTATAVNTSVFLKQQNIGSTIRFPSFIKQLDMMGIDYRRDKFLKSVVEHAVLRDLRLLKHKARIPVSKGLTLFGIMDETGFLDENQVFITYDKVNSKSGAPMDTTLRDGPVLVTRSPALHPGDIQFVTMVSPDAGHPLRRLRNCIVFSQRGSRDLPSQLGGGDLDGDMFNVIWDPRARPNKTFKPADYPRVAPIPLNRPVTSDDIADFFINFMASDILGLIAMRHQAIADIQQEGTRDADCIKLAGMHSAAVDYSKTGIAVNWSDMPRAPRSKPDFLSPAPPVNVYDLGQLGHIADDAMDDDDEGEDGMGKIKIRYHRSEKILGRLYRDINEEKIWNEHIHRTVSMNGPSVWDQLKGIFRAELESYGIRIDTSRHLQQAWKIRNLYEDSVVDSMWHFSENPRSHITEVEAFCGTILNRRGTQTRQQRDASIRLKDAMDRDMAWISKLIRHRSDDSGKDVDDVEYTSGTDDDADESGHDAIQLSWVCFLIGCSKSTDKANAVYQLKSFRIIAAACLLKEINCLKTRVAGNA
ncbi:hypothetical protein QQS21_008509 [Conoideocrella luteorostrata]|uniref:RNA-dependent RNA polymerase n=1 Tax=Conoideocrella luteorostrata TaxID=1105319 RepID=A0AAJ0FR55_9HYPO|nr:hypothetical protein QQS21_008509 [Conoideocrella luteorostrata]